MTQKERRPGKDCGHSRKEEEGHYHPLTQAWLGPIPLYPRHQRNSRKSTKENLLRASKIHNTTTQTSNLSHFNTPAEAQMIRVNLRALVLLFMYGMLRCFNYIENPTTYWSWYGGETPVGFIWEVYS